MDSKVMIMDENTICRALARMTHEIIERNEGVDDIVLLGIRSRGVHLAQVLKENILKFEGKEVPLGILDATKNRDDLTEEEKNRRYLGSEISFSLSDRTVIIVDDVLYTGRTVRAAIETVFSMARPKKVQFAVLVDRGHRELPIRPDFVGKNIPTSSNETVRVEFDKEKSVYIIKGEQK